MAATIFFIGFGSSSMFALRRLVARERISADFLFRFQPDPTHGDDGAGMLHLCELQVLCRICVVNRDGEVVENWLITKTAFPSPRSEVTSHQGEEGVSKLAKRSLFTFSLCATIAGRVNITNDPPSLCCFLELCADRTLSSFSSCVILSVDWGCVEDRRVSALSEGDGFVRSISSRLTFRMPL